MTESYDLSFTVNTPLSFVKDVESEDREGLTLVRGLAVSKEVNLKFLRFTDQAISSAVEHFLSSPRKPRVLIDHKIDSSRVVGVVKSLSSDPRGLFFTIDLNPNHPSGIFHSVKRGDVDAVSVGGYSTSITCSLCGQELRDCEHFLGEDYEGKTAIGFVNDFHLTELSLTAFPADQQALITEALSLAQSLNDSKLLFGPSYQERKNLPDSSFAMPKERKLPYKDANGKVVCSWVRDALRLAPKVKGGVPESAMRKLRSAAKQCGIDTSQSLLNDSFKNTEKFINDKELCECDVKMTETVKEEVKEKDTSTNVTLTDSQEKILQSALEKLSKENEILMQKLKEQESFINQIRERERQEKISKLLELTTLKREELEQYTDEMLDNALKVLEKVQVKQDSKPSGKSVVVQTYGSDIEETKEFIRQLFGFPKPTEQAKKRAQEIKLMREKGLI